MNNYESVYRQANVPLPTCRLVAREGKLSRHLAAGFPTADATWVWFRADHSSWKGSWYWRVGDGHLVTKTGKTLILRDHPTLSIEPITSILSRSAKRLIPPKEKRKKEKTCMWCSAPPAYINARNGLFCADHAEAGCVPLREDVQKVAEERALARRHIANARKNGA